MQKRLAFAAGVLLSLVFAAASARADDLSPGSMRIPAGISALAEAAGLHRSDPSTILIDIVRLAFAVPDNASDAGTTARIAVRRSLKNPGPAGDLVPLPWGASLWRDHVLHEHVADDRLAAAIF